MLNILQQFYIISKSNDYIFEKFDDKDAKKTHFSMQIEFPKKSNRRISMNKTKSSLQKDVFLSTSFKKTTKFSKKMTLFFRFNL
jgi:hypothetical protein